MTDFELLSIVLMILGIVVSILIVYIDHTKSDHRPKIYVYFLKSIHISLD